MDISGKSCTPCQGGVSPLTRDQAEVFLEKTTGWDLDGESRVIERRFPFDDFVSAMAFAGRVGDLAESEGHHPELVVGWGYCTVRFWTHKINGLHENDFIMAAKVNALGT